HPVSSQERPAARLVVSVAADNETYIPGQAVHVSVQLMNAGDGIAYLWFGSTCPDSFSFLAVDGSVVYDYRAHVPCGPMFTNLTLGPETRAPSGSPGLKRPTRVSLSRPSAPIGFRGSCYPRSHRRVPRARRRSSSCLGPRDRSSNSPLRRLSRCS